MHATRPHPHSQFACAANPQALRCPPAWPDGLAFCLILPDAAAHPVAYGNRHSLAQAIHRRRGDDALRLVPERISFRGKVRDCVAVFADELAADGAATGSTRLIGHAWIGGGDWRALEAALAAITPDRGR